MPGYSKMRLSVSVGGVLTRDETIGEAAMRADQLMYLAKQRKNMVVTEKDQIWVVRTMLSVRKTAEKNSAS